MCLINNFHPSCRWLTDPLTSAETSLCHREAGERDKRKRDGDIGQRRSELRHPPFLSSHCPPHAYFYFHWDTQWEALRRRDLLTSQCICIGNSMISSDIWHKYHEWYFKFETILKYHEWYLCQISFTNHAIICLCYYPQKVCNFHM